MVSHYVIFIYKEIKNYFTQFFRVVIEKVVFVLISFIKNIKKFNPFVFFPLTLQQDQQQQHARQQRTWVVSGAVIYKFP